MYSMDYEHKNNLCVCCVNRALLFFLMPGKPGFALGSIKQSDLFDDIDQDTCEFRIQKQHTVENRRQRQRTQRCHEF